MITPFWLHRTQEATGHLLPVSVFFLPCDSAILGARPNIDLAASVNHNPRPGSSSSAILQRVLCRVSQDRRQKATRQTDWPAANLLELQPCFRLGRCTALHCRISGQPTVRIPPSNSIIQIPSSSPPRAPPARTAIRHPSNRRIPSCSYPRTQRLTGLVLPLLFCSVRWTEQRALAACRVVSQNTKAGARNRWPSRLTAHESPQSQLTFATSCGKPSHRILSPWSPCRLHPAASRLLSLPCLEPTMTTLRRPMQLSLPL